MQFFVPDYYREFRCIAHACRHTCCQGWEIDIDAESLTRFQALEGPFGQRLQAAIDLSGDAPHFQLGDGDRCPFLNEDHLCDMILALGEDSLCQICQDHPRFRNFFSGRTEVGLGLCCEAAANLILLRQAPMKLVPLDSGEETLTEEEAALLSLREHLFAILQDRSQPVEGRISAMLARVDARLPELPPEDWAALFGRLERLDPAWDKVLDGLALGPWETGFLSQPWWQVAFEQLAVYFLFRHLAGALEDGDIQGRVALSALSWQMVLQLCAVESARRSLTAEVFTDLARRYSCEVEYSEDNLLSLLDYLFALE